MPSVSSSQLSIEPILFEDTLVSDLKLPAKRYTITARSQLKDGLTLVFAHATGMHKEQWEPIIFALLPRPNILEAWAVEWPSHGAGARANASAMARRKEGVGTCCVTVSVNVHLSTDSWLSASTEWGSLIAALMRSRAIDSSHSVGIGHSGGCSAL